MLKTVVRLGLVVASATLVACGGSSDAANSGSMAGNSGSMSGMDHGTATTGTGALDQKFVAGMLPHHQAAIDMAKAELQKGKNPQVKALAQTIINEQTGEQGVMNSVAKTHSWNMASMSSAPDQLMGQPIQMGMGQMAGQVSAATDPDRTFLKLMIPHHAMAVLMADTQVKSGTDSQLKQLAASIVSGQAKEIGDMQALLGPGA